MPTEASIHKASANHVEEVLRLLSTQLREHGIEISEAKLLAAVEGVFEDPRRGAILMALMDGQCVGVAYISFVWALEQGGCSGWLEELYVEPAFRASGTGTALLHAAIAECKSFGCAALDLEIDADHERVRSLYERHGFQTLTRQRLVKRFCE